MIKPKKGTPLYYVKLLEKAENATSRKKAQKILKKLKEHQERING